ncbi:MAG: Asp-tRNA(Asn)/Glu-tRNA(Gln) amidotransferase subunit GatC [Chloroflexi bacterium]|nr:Asp-tRNA(Asn)/Glu-tRNA(Gln) amidotransferase subunit GatC [Chloroflexota bacterium]MYI81767.1 Asp-tRNA(Asn)/Glu-tRNA(Gln) amidotransferase subunit GatC [Chloroflexota bacterium]
MDLSSDEVRHIARLARIALSDEETERLRGELSSILGHCQALSAIDTSGVAPTAQSFSLVNVERPDEPQAAAPVSEVLANAPAREGDYIRVRAVLDQPGG